MIDFHRSNTGHARTTGFRGGGTAEPNASRTVRRCVPNRDANARIDTPGSNRRARRICSYNSTRDLFAMNPTVHNEHARQVDTPRRQPGGAKTGEHNPFKWGQNR
jgi:hypothetical protein